MNPLRPDLRPAADLPRTAPIVIVGGGIVGVATAFFLRQRNLDAIVVDAEPGIGTRTTAMSAHCIRAQFSEPDNIRMMAESLAFYEAFATRCDLDGAAANVGLCQQGYLFASTDAADIDPFAERVARQRDAGLDDVEQLDGPEVRARFPWLSDRIVTATFRARDGWIDSQRAVAWMAVASRVPIYTGVRVLSIDVEAGVVTGVTTTAGRIASPAVILAAGPASRELSPEPLPLTLLRRHRVIVAANPAIPQHGPVTIDANTGAHWRPHQGGALAAWALPERDSEAAWPVPADPGFLERVLRGEDGIGRLAPLWHELAPNLTPDQLLLTAGQYTMTPDHRPLVGPACATGGLYLNTGYSGHGIMGAPAGARMLAETLDSTESTANTFTPQRFSGAAPPPDIERVVI